MKGIRSLFHFGTGIGVLCCLLMLTGCARTVTNKSELLQMDIEVALRGPLSPSDYLVIAFSTTAPPITPSGSDHPYFPLPGQTMDTSLLRLNFPLESYYANYFSSWSDYILCQLGGPSFYTSGSTGFPATTTDNTSIAPDSTFQISHNFNASTSTLKMSFFIGDITGATAGNTLYITMMTTRHNGTAQGKSGYFQDILLTPIAIQLRAGQEIQKLPGQESIDARLPAASDIQAWRVSIF
jgi:hypothetical protein